MAKCDSFRVQHKEIFEVADKISSKLLPTALANDATEVRSLLSSMAGKLSVHLAMEDKSLYPTMLASSNPETKKTAEQFILEMGTLAVAFKQFTQAWPNADAIKKDPEAFCAQAKSVFDAIAKRVAREESVLYPLADLI